MVEMISYVIVAIYLIVCEIGISSWEKKAIGQPVYEPRKRLLKFYRLSILLTIGIFVVAGIAAVTVR